MESRVETILNALIDGETIDFEPRSKLEEYLKNCINKTGTEGLPEPTSRLDALMYKLAETIEGSGSGETESYKIKDFSNFCFGGKRIDELESIDTSNGTDFSYMFNGCGDLTTIPQLDTSNGTDFSYMFSNCGDLTTIPQLDTSNGTNFSGMFNYCMDLTTIPQLDTSNGTKFSSMFYYCQQLTTIALLILPTSSRALSSTFTQCSALSDITVQGTVYHNLSFQWCPLSVDSMKSVISCLANYAGTYNDGAYKVTFSDTCWEALEADGLSIPDDTYLSWKEYVNLGLGWAT